MEENRSFDHFFGFYPGVNGVNAQNFNPFNTSNPSSGGYNVSQNAPYVAPCDPNHGTPATTLKIFGANAVARGDFSKASMDGFVEFETNNHKANACDVMRVFTPDRLPVITTLANEYVLFDRFFCSHAGPTWPNRMFFLSATSGGSTETGPWYHDKVGQLFPQKTFFDQITESGLTWKNYYNDTPWELFMESIAHNPDNLVSMEQFFQDAEEGTLPNYAFINPRGGINITTGVGCNDMHPDHDIAAGEQYYKDIYEALRASPQWNETLFIITFDEHGGFYDHVPTPLNVPPPGDGETSYPDAGILFNRLGIRIPTLLISPWVPKGLIVSEPPAAQKPAPDSEYDLTSIMASARKILGLNLPPLTKRDAWSATFENVVDILDTPRTDCPLHLPDAPPLTLSAEAEAEQPPNDLQMHIMTVLSHLNQMPYPDHIQKQEDFSHWANVHFHSHVKRTVHWKQSKNPQATYSVIVQPVASTNWKEAAWEVNHDSGVSFMTVSTKTLVSHIEVTTTDKQNHTQITYPLAVPYCLDAGDSKAGTIITISACYPSSKPSDNRDDSQHWVWEKDSTLRPYTDRTLCLTNNYYKGDLKVTLETCKGTVEQHYAYLGAALGNSASGQIQYGSSVNSLGVITA